MLSSPQTPGTDAASAHTITLTEKEGEKGGLPHLLCLLMTECVAGFVDHELHWSLKEDHHKVQ